MHMCERRRREIVEQETYLCFCGAAMSSFATMLKRRQKLGSCTAIVLVRVVVPLSWLGI